MALSRRQLGADEQIVVEVRLGVGRLVGPTIAVTMGAALAIAVLVLANQPDQPHHRWLRIVAAVAGLATVVCLLWLVGRVAQWRAQTVAVTTDRLVLSHGVIRRRSDQVLLRRVVDAHVDRRLAQRLVGRGDLVLELADGPAVLVVGVPKPDALGRVVLRQAGLEASVAPAPDGPASGPWRAPRPMVVTELDPTPPRGTPSVSAWASTSDLIRLDEIDRLEAEGALDRAEADRRRAEIAGGG